MIKLINEILDARAFKRAKKKADKLHREFRCRYYVLPKANGRGYSVISSRRVSNFNRKHGKKMKMNINELLRLSYYHTADSLGNLN